MLVLSEPSIEQLEILHSHLNCSFSPELLSIMGVVIIGGFEMNPTTIRRFSEVIDELKDTIDVFVMPSSNKERQELFPLQPFNGIYFPKSQREIGLCSNPQLFEADKGLQIHVSCGQNARNMIKNGTLIRD